MVLLILIGGALLFWLSGGGRAFRGASAGDLRALLWGGLALAGLLLAIVLLLTGRGLVAFAALAVFGPAIWQATRRVAPAAAAAPRTDAAVMTRDEAYAVLGLPRGAPADDVRAAHRRLMRSAHPDAGGSDWVAARINRARDILLAA